MPAPESAAARLSPADLLQALQQRLACTGRSHTALIAIALSPADRSLAIGRGRTERAVLAEVGRRVAAVLRSADRYAWVSREELWVMLVDLPSESLAEFAARSLIERLAQPIAVLPSGGAAPIRLQPSVGVACTAGVDGADALSMISLATEAAVRHAGGAPGIRLRRVRAGRNDGPSQAQLERELAQALDDNELEVHFQPQVELRSGQCRSAEALIRWRHRDGRMADPETIVSICERRELILQLTRFTLNTALRHAASWSSLGLELDIAVNLSAATLSDPALPAMVSQALDTWETPANRLTLELTESALIRNRKVAGDTMKQLGQLGCRLSIDDFGTGYSPYTYLRQFSFNELKIDKSFVRPASTGGADLRIVRSLVDLAHTFGMLAVAEGVEDDASQRVLSALGCDLAQGWHFSAALAPHDFTTWCLAHDPGAAQARRAAPARRPA